MKGRLIPLYFKEGCTSKFDIQLDRLREMLKSEAEMLDPVALGDRLPEAEAVVFPEILGEAYRQVDDFKKIKIPILVITSEFATQSMWDWEITTYLKAHNVDLVLTYDVDDTKKACKALAVKRELAKSKFLVFQDNPGEGCQPDIFKCFYWWESECVQRIKDKFGVTVVKKSFRKLGERAKSISDNIARDLVQQKSLFAEGLAEKPLLSAVKMYIALKEEIAMEPEIIAMGINCLNESHFSDTTPCLAWTMLYEEVGLIWGCEADIVSMLTQYILNKSLNAPCMMTNLYPFLMGMAALKHEKIPRFPEVESKPEDHILLAHCGYLGVVPKCFCSKWKLKPKVLGIVDDNAIVVDGEMPTGDITLAKLHPGMNKIMSVAGNLERYVQYENSDCLNGAVVKVANGPALMNALYSHHYCLLTGKRSSEIELIAKMFDFDVEKM